MIFLIFAEQNGDYSGKKITEKETDCMCKRKWAFPYSLMFINYQDEL